jgi:hypothetical protein
MPLPVPKVVSVEVIAAQPTDADRAMSAQLSAETQRSLPDAAFIVRIRLETIPPATGQGWALYVGDTRIPKYWEYPGGIYFKVLDGAFLGEHQGEKLRFSENGETFVDTGRTLPGPRTSRAKGVAAARVLPTQSEVLSDVAPARPARNKATREKSKRKKATRKRARPARAKKAVSSRARRARRRKPRRPRR